MKTKLFISLVMCGAIFASSCSKDEPVINDATQEPNIEDIVEAEAPAKEFSDKISLWSYNAAIMEVDSLSVSNGIVLQNLSGVPRLHGFEEFNEYEGWYGNKGPDGCYYENHCFQIFWRHFDSKDVISFNFTEERENLRIAAVCALESRVDLKVREPEKYFERLEEPKTLWQHEDYARIEVKDGKTVSVNLSNMDDPDYFRVYYFFLEASPTQEEWDKGYRIARCTYVLCQNEMWLVL